MGWNIIMINKIKSGYDANSRQHVLIFYLYNIYEAEKVRINLLPRLRIHVGFTIDVLLEKNRVIVKYANKED